MFPFLLCLVLSCKTWSAVKPEAWLASPGSAVGRFFRYFICAAARLRAACRRVRSKVRDRSALSPRPEQDSNFPNNFCSHEVALTESPGKVWKAPSQPESRWLTGPERPVHTSSVSAAGPARSVQQIQLFSTLP